MKKITTTALLLTLINLLTAQKFIADYTVAKEDVLRNIPVEFINAARNNLKIAYQHTSHGTHVSYGLFGLQNYKAGDAVLFGITNNNPTTGKLEFHDYALSGYAESGVDASDLSRNETAFIQATRNFLNDPDNASINVIMWSWCDIAGHNVSVNYLPGMQTLINEYGVGGSMIGDAEGQRSTPVHFIFMTGHANANNNIGDGKPKNQADLITNFCNANNYFCLDYYSIDTHCMNNNYWDDSSDDAQSTKYGGNFYIDFQNANAIGNGFYENKTSPGGSVAYGQHNTQHITANRKAYAMWWILARLAGWNGENTNAARNNSNSNFDFYYSASTQEIIISGFESIKKGSFKLISITGMECLNTTFEQNCINLNTIKPGVYIAQVVVEGKNVTKKIIIY